MNIVYFFGAGASHAIHESIPLMDFLPLFRGRYASQWDKVRGALSDAGFSEGGGNAIFLPPQTHPFPNLEALLVAIEDQVASSDPKIAQAAELAYLLIKEMINTSLVDLDREVVQKLPRTPYDDFAEAIAAQTGHHHRIISFNYDPWLERALQKTKCWQPGSGYMSKNDFGGNLDFVGSSRKTDKVLHRDTESLVKVLKPHGSLSWLVTDNPAAAPCVILNSDDPSSGQITTLEPGESAVQLNGHKWQPAIIPPSRFKSIGGDFVYRLYKSIEAELREARGIVIIGWSMPVTDIYMTQRIT